MMLLVDPAAAFAREFGPWAALFVVAGGAVWRTVRKFTGWAKPKIEELVATHIKFVDKVGQDLQMTTAVLIENKARLAEIEESQRALCESSRDVADAVRKLCDHMEADNGPR